MTALNLTNKMLHTSIFLLTLITIDLVHPLKSLAYCPLGCNCDDVTLIVKCGEGDLDVLPIALNPSIQRLVINKNKIKRIDSSIQFYSELTLLDLSYNHLFSIPQQTFIYQKKLQELHLAYNKISTLSNKTLTGLESLLILNLRGNILDEIASGIFSSLPNLEELNLGENRISKIDLNAFQGLNNLRILYLDDNTLSTIPSPTFYAIPNLAELYLGTNSFNTIYKDTFYHLSKLTKLDLHSVGLSNISNESFRGLENLRTLDISDNKLQKIPSLELSTLIRLEELSIGQNTFDVVPEGAFVGLSNLKKIQITGGLALKKIENGAFAMNTNLDKLILTSNKMLSEIEEGAFSGLPYLKNVILKENGLQTLAEGLFAWNELNVLDLSDNPIHCDCRILWLKNLLISKNSTTKGMINDIVCMSPPKVKRASLQKLTSDQLGCSNYDPKQQAMLGGLLVGSVATLTALTLILYRYRRKINEFLKFGCGNSALGRKKREYQKTFSDEDYITRYPHPCNMGFHPSFTNYQHYHPTNIRPMPVTEL